MYIGIYQIYPLYHYLLVDEATCKKDSSADSDSSGRSHPSRGVVVAIGANALIVMEWHRPEIRRDKMMSCSQGEQLDAIGTSNDCPNHHLHFGFILEKYFDFAGKPLLPSPPKEKQPLYSKTWLQHGTCNPASSNSDGNGLIKSCKVRPEHWNTRRVAHFGFCWNICRYHVLDESIA